MKTIDIIGYNLADGISVIESELVGFEIEIEKVDRDTYRTHESIFPIEERIIKIIQNEKSIKLYVTEI